MSDNDKNLKKSADKKDLIVQKYILLREKIIQSYTKGCKILNTVKIMIAVIFTIFTVIAVWLSNMPGSNKGSWLVLWIFMILFNIAIFTVTDYFKHLVKTKVIPYLQNDEQIEFGKYNVFSENDEEDEENEENKEED